MGEHKGDVEDLIQQSLLNIGRHELDNLAQILAFECFIQLERLREMLASSQEAERIIGYVDSLSTEQKKLLVGRVTLRFQQYPQTIVPSGIPDEKERITRGW